MNWQEVCEHPNLQNLPVKIELNAKGRNASLLPIGQLPMSKKKSQRYEMKIEGKYQPYCQVIIYLLNKRFAQELGNC